MALRWLDIDHNRRHEPRLFYHGEVEFGTACMVWPFVRRVASTYFAFVRNSGETEPMTLVSLVLRSQFLEHLPYTYSFGMTLLAHYLVRAFVTAPSKPHLS